MIDIGVNLLHPQFDADRGVVIDRARTAGGDEPARGREGLRHADADDRGSLDRRLGNAERADDLELAYPVGMHGAPTTR